RSMLATVGVALFFIATSCNSNADKTTDGKDSTGATASKPDNQKLKAEIQEIETAYANAQSAGDMDKVANYYAADAVTMPNNLPMMSGRDAIKKDLEEGYAKRKGTTVTYDVLDAFGCENYATEIGTSTRKDSTGKTIYTGKYMALWEKRDGKWVCIRDISNDDKKED
ncbi:MAG: nuclear transport factor 2 family protein, partial [Chitinophagaceae bacterium]